MFDPKIFAGGFEPPAIDQMPDFGPAPDVAPPAPLAPPPAPPPAPAPAPVFAPVFAPSPIQIKKPKGLAIAPDVARKAQGIYPREAAQKQQLINNAKAPPTPTGAWGAPK